MSYFGIGYETRIMSAHRTPDKAAEYAATAQERGLEAIIAGAGAAAHLAGAIAANTTLPVIGIPIDSSSLKGLDALLATVQMPSGIPVATMAIGKAGAANAGIFAAQIVARTDAKVAAKLAEFKKEMAAGAEEGPEIVNSKARNWRVEDFSPAIEALRQGDVIVFPTETLYGLGADALNEAAVDTVFNLKGRDAHNPLSVLVANQTMLRTLVATIPAAARRLMNRYWPGPLTLVLPGRKDIPKPLCNTAGGIAVRISSQPIATLLVKALGHPVTATSANPSGKEPARTLQEAKRYFADQIPVYVDGGTLTSKSGSTVLEVMDNRIRIIREGEISALELQNVLGGKYPTA